MVLTSIPGVSERMASKMTDHFGSEEAVEESRSLLETLAQPVEPMLTLDLDSVASGSTRSDKSA